jgi:hypothetical protein
MRMQTLALAALTWAGLVWADAPTAGDLQTPIALKAGDKLINVDIGHAAPFVADLSGDGTPQLLVGQFGEGKLRIYPNIGDRSAPRFKDFTWFDGKVPSG